MVDLNALKPEDIPPEPPEFETPSPERAGKLKKEKPEKEKRSIPPKRKGQFVAPLTQLYAGIGAMAMPFDPVCGGVVVASAEDCAIALDNLAYQNENVRRALIALTQGSAWGSVVIAHAPIIMMIMQHHMPGALPVQLRAVNSETDEAA